MVERLVGSMLVEVLNVVANEAFELLLVPNDRAVEEFAADRSEPSFCEAN